MPVFEYKCPQCQHEEKQLQPMSAKMNCPKCLAIMKLKISVPGKPVIK